MKSATYSLTDGTKRTIEYDETAPCIHCGLPVWEASMGGTRLCPWCDTGRYRDGCIHEYKFRNDGKAHVRFREGDMNCWHHGQGGERASEAMARVTEGMGG